MEGFTLSTLLNQVCDKLSHYQFAAKWTTNTLAYFFHDLLQSLDHGNMYAHVFFADFTKDSTWWTTTF